MLSAFRPQPALIAPSGFASAACVACRHIYGVRAAFGFRPQALPVVVERAGVPAFVLFRAASGLASADLVAVFAADLASVVGLAVTVGLVSGLASAADLVSAGLAFSAVGLAVGLGSVLADYRALTFASACLQHSCCRPCPCRVQTVASSPCGH